MLGRNGNAKDDSRGLLSHDGIGDDDDEVVWEHEQSSAQSDRNTTSEVWDQDPLSETVDAPSDRARAPLVPATKDSLADSEAAHELDTEFQRIYHTVQKDQREKARFYRDMDAACAAYSTRRDEMRDRQREREAAIEVPWLAARRRREWQRVSAIASGAATIMTCFWGGSVARVDEVPPRVPWPPPHLARIQEVHAGEREALREAHLAVVRELYTNYGFDLPRREEGDDHDGHDEMEHVCIEPRLLAEVLGTMPLPGEDEDDAADAEERAGK